MSCLVFQCSFFCICEKMLGIALTFSGPYAISKSPPQGTCVWLSLSDNPRRTLTIKGRELCRAPLVFCRLNDGLSLLSMSLFQSNVFCNLRFLVTARTLLSIGVLKTHFKEIVFKHKFHVFLKDSFDFFSILILLFQE